MRAARRKCREKAIRANVIISAAAVSSDAMLVWLLHEKPHPEWSVLFLAEIKGRVASLTYLQYRQANVSMPALLCEFLFAEPLELDAYTLTLRLNPEPQTLNPSKITPVEGQAYISLAAINGCIITGDRCTSEEAVSRSLWTFVSKIDIGDEKGQADALCRM